MQLSTHHFLGRAVGEKEGSGDEWFAIVVRIVCSEMEPVMFACSAWCISTCLRHVRQP